MCLTLFITFFLSAAFPAYNRDFVIIANRSLAGVEISAGDLRNIYLGTRTTLEGQHVEPVLAQSGPAHHQFVAACLGKTETGLRNYFRSLVFAGKGGILKTFPSTGELVQYVARTKGAIGYVDDGAELAGVTRVTLK